MNETQLNRFRNGTSLRAYLGAAAVVVLAIGAAMVFRRLPHANLSLLFLTAVILVAARWGLWPSIFSSVLSFLALNFFFTVPFYTFKVEEEGDIATLIFFLAMAGLTGNLAARMRAEAAKKQASLGRVSELLEFSRQMAAAANADEALEALVHRLSGTLCVSAFASVPDEAGELKARAASMLPGAMPQPHSRSMRRAWESTLEQRQVDVAGWIVWSLATSGGPLGLVALESAGMDVELRELVESLCDQTSIAVERTLLVDSLKEAQLSSETERLRSALLSSVSHDLRTPLASIIGSTTSVLEYHEVLKADDRQALLQTVVSEAQRLNRYIQNLLDMTRFERQPFDLKRDWVDLNDLVSAAVERLDALLADVELKVEIAPDVAVLKVQGALLEQVFVNLLDNAAGFAPTGSSVIVRAYKDKADVVIEVSDQGPGIPPDDRSKVFDMFYRVLRGDRQRPGTGLGLAICKSVIKAHGGSIGIGPGSSGTGTVMRIELPLSENSVDEQ